MNPFNRIILALLPFLVSSTHADEVSWQSSGLGKEPTRAEFSELYAGIRAVQTKSGGIRTRQITLTDASYDKIQATLKTEKLYGGVFPDELAFLVCELNSNFCSIQDIGKKGKKTVWRNTQNFLITVPDIRVEPSKVLRPYKKSAGDEIAKVVVEDREGCEAFDEKCAMLLRKLNDDTTGQKLEVSYSGTILVPSKSFHTKLDYSMLGRTENQAPVQLPSAASNPNNPAARTKEPDSPRFTPAGSRVDENILLRLQPRGLQSESAAVDGRLGREELLSLIASSDAKVTDRVPIGLMDGAVNLTHCDFGTSITLLANDIALPKRPAMKCGNFSSIDPSIRENHGTHLAGLMFARRDAKSGRGVNPEASVVVVSFDPWALRTDSEHRRADQLLSLLIPEVKVINISWSYQTLSDTNIGRNDLIATTIRSTSIANTKLFVVAAGDAGTEYKKGSPCDQPACLGSLPNVLVVSSLTASREMPGIPYSAGKAVANYGIDVHIGVPAVNVVSSLWDNQMGRMSGTSQAAPVVSAAASLMFAKGAVNASQVKNRLIYTAALFSSLDGKLFGGRLDVATALDMKSTKIVTKSENLVANQARVRMFPPLVRSTDSTSSSISMNLAETGDPLSLPFEKVRRLHRRTDNRDLFDLFYFDGSRLVREKVRISPGYLRPESAYLEIYPGGQKIPFVELNDYVAAIPEQVQ